VGGREGRLERVNLATGAVEGRFEGHSGNVLHVVLFDEGRRLLSSTQTGELFLWDTATGELLRRFDVGVSGAIYSFDLLSGGARVAAGLGSNAVGIFDVATGQRLSMLVGHSGSVYSVDVSPDSRFILTGGRDGFAILWDASTGAERARLTEDGATIWSVAFNALGDQFAVGTANGQISIYDAATVDRVQRFSFEEVVFTLTFSADGRRLYSGHNDGRVAAWVVFRGDDATAWAQANRYIRELTCFERDLYRVEPLCADA
jgi:WD40 repeat protein